MIYYNEQLNLENDLLTNNLICFKCYLSSISMDCSYSCGKNQYQIRYGASYQTSQVTCLQGEGSKGFDNSYIKGYKY